MAESVRAETIWGEWMAAAQAGDQAAYRRLLGEIRHWLQLYYRGRLPPGMVEDATQESLLAVHEKRHTYDPSRPFGPWLAAIARYKWIDRLRAMHSAPTEPLSDALAIGDHAAAVESAFELGRLLQCLKPGQAEVIRLVKLQGLSIEEASIRTGQSASLVKVNIHRGLSRLASMVRGRNDAR